MGMEKHNSYSRCQHSWNKALMMMMMIMIEFTARGFTFLSFDLSLKWGRLIRKRLYSFHSNVVLHWIVSMMGPIIIFYYINAGISYSIFCIIKKNQFFATMSSPLIEMQFFAGMLGFTATPLLLPVYKLYSLP